jgi:hypothetical protein
MDFFKKKIDFFLKKSQTNAPKMPLKLSGRLFFLFQDFQFLLESIHFIFHVCMFGSE